MGKKKRTLPTVLHDEGYVYRLNLDDDGNPSLTPRGRRRSANELSYGYLTPGWRKALEPYAPASRVLTDKDWATVEAVLERYIFNLASECGAYSWADAIGTLDRTAKAASDLLAACNGGVASDFIWERIEAVGDTPFTAFSRDDFYPLLSALNRRAHLLRAAMNAERDRGDQLSVFAFRHFVFDIANFYQDMGGDVNVSRISAAHVGKTRLSKFSAFAWQAMKQIPENLREHCSNPEGWAFAEALYDQLKPWRRNPKLYRSD